MANMSYSSDGVTPSFSLAFAPPPTQQSLLNLPALPSGVSLQFIKESESVIDIRMNATIPGTSSVTLSYSNSNSTNGGDPVTTGESKNLTLPKPEHLYFPRSLYLCKLSIFLEVSEVQKTKFGIVLFLIATAVGCGGGEWQ